MINDGYMLLNIKSFKEFNLLGDMKEICIEEGLLYIESLQLKNFTRPSLEKLGKNNNEEILVFSKTPKEPKKPLTLDEW